MNIVYESSKCKERYSVQADAQSCEQTHKCKSHNLIYLISIDTSVNAGVYSKCKDCEEIIYWHSTNWQDAEFLALVDFCKITLSEKRFGIPISKIENKESQLMIQKYVNEKRKDNFKNKILKL